MGPLINMLNEDRLGKRKFSISSPRMPAFSELQEAAKPTPQITIITQTSGSPIDSPELVSLHETIKKMVKQNEELVAHNKEMAVYLKDPANRRATINRDLLIKWDKEAAELKKLARF
jgi:hypothetical protein